MKPGSPMALLLLAAGCASVPGQDEPVDDGERHWSGSISERYRARTDGEQDDHDLLTIVSLQTGELERDGWAASFLARANLDVDGTDQDSPFDSLSDAEGDQLDADLYHAWVDLPVGDGLEALRLGRQMLHETPEFAWFDGASLSSLARGEQAWQFGLYGGVPVHLYESSAGEDLAAGAWAAGSPWTGGRARLDVMRLEDEVVLGPLDDDLIGLDLRHSASAELFLDGHVSWIEGDARDARVGLAWMPQDWTLRLRHTSLLETQSERSLEADPFFNTLRDLFPYEQTQATVVRDWAHVMLELGGDVRRVDDEDDVGAFNRDFERGWVSMTLVDVLPEELLFTVSADRWVSDANENEGLGFDLVKQLGQNEAAIGTFYSLYKIDLFLDQEREDVRTWFLRWRRRPKQGLGVDLRYEYENASGDDIHGLRAVLTWRF